MAANASPAMIVSFTDTLTQGGTATINITLPSGSGYTVKSVTLTGTVAGTTATVTANSGATAIFGGAVTVGNATVTFPTSTATPPVAINNLRVVCGNVGGIITGGFFTMVSASPMTFTSVVS